MSELNENEFEHEGKWYRAVDEEGCFGCAFELRGDFCLNIDRPSCVAKVRKDHRNVIFVEDKAVAAWNTRAESAALTAMTAERDQWKDLFLNTMGQINNADDRNPMCPCCAIIFEAIQRMPK